MINGWSTYYYNGNQYFKHTSGLIVVWQGTNSGAAHGAVKILFRRKVKVNAS